MAVSRIGNAKRNLFWGLINRVISLLLPFLTRTAIIYYLGSLYLGLNGLYSSILNILSLAELGFGSAMVYSMYQPLAKGATDEVCALLNLYRKIYRIIGFIVLTIGLVILPFLPQLIHGDVPADINIFVLYLVYLCNSVLSYFLFAYKSSLLTADQRSDIISNISTTLSIASNIASLVAICFFRNYYVYVLLVPLFTIIRNLVTSIVVDKKYPQFTCRGTIEDDKLKDIKKRVAGLFIYRICYVARDSFDGVVISAYLGLTVLAKYNNYYYITAIITGFLATIKTSITASVGNSIATESVEKNHLDFNKCQLLYMWCSSWCTVCLYCLFQHFIKMWAGEAYLFDDYLMGIFCIYFFCYKLGDICAVYRQAAGLWWEDRYRPIVESVVNLTLNIILVKLIGVSGVMLSTIFCLVFINSIWASHVLYSKYFTHFKQIEYIKRECFYAIITLLAAFLTSELCTVVSDVNIMGLLLKFVICLFLPNIIFFLCFRLLPEYKDSIMLLKMLVRK